MTALFSLLSSKTIQGALGYAICYVIAGTFPDTAHALAPVANGFFAWGGLGAIHKLIKAERAGQKAEQAVSELTEQLLGPGPVSDTPGLSGLTELRGSPLKGNTRAVRRKVGDLGRKAAFVFALLTAATLGACGRYAPCASTFDGWDHAAHCAESLMPLIRRGCDALPPDDEGRSHDDATTIPPAPPQPNPGGLEPNPGPAPAGAAGGESSLACR